MTIIERIINELEFKGLKKSDLAKHLNKSKGQVSMWESRNSNPPAELIPDIAKFLNVSIDYILTGSEKTHTRFQHSLGVMSIAKEMAERQGDLSGGVYHGGKEPTILKNKNKNPEIQQIIHKLTTVEIPDDVIEFINNALDAYKK